MLSLNLVYIPEPWTITYVRGKRLVHPVQLCALMNNQVYLVPGKRDDRTKV